MTILFSELLRADDYVQPLLHGFRSPEFLQLNHAYKQHIAP